LFPSRISTGRHPLRTKATVSHGYTSQRVIALFLWLACLPPREARASGTRLKRPALFSDFDGNNVTGVRDVFCGPTCGEQKTWLAPDPRDRARGCRRWWASRERNGWAFRELTRANLVLEANSEAQRRVRFWGKEERRAGTRRIGSYSGFRGAVVWRRRTEGSVLGLVVAGDTLAPASPPPYPAIAEPFAAAQVGGRRQTRVLRRRG